MNGFRRRAILGTSASLLALGAAGQPLRAATATRPIRIGLVTPQAGNDAPYSQGDAFVLGLVRKAVGAGITVGGVAHPVEILVRDGGSDAARATAAAQDLITHAHVDMILAGDNSGSVVRVADACELAGMPCITMGVPWQDYLARRAVKPKASPRAFHFYWGIDDLIAVQRDLWGDLPSNRKVGALWPHGPEGDALADARNGFPSAIAKTHFQIAAVERYDSGARDFSTAIARFKNAGVEILTGYFDNADFAPFWKQSASLGFKPKIATISGATYFPQALEPLGESAFGLAVEIEWSPSGPFKSSLIPGMEGRDFAAQYIDATGKQWFQPLAYKFALFEVAIDALRRARELAPAPIARAIAATNCQTLVGPVRFGSGPGKTIAVMPLAGGQWRQGKRFPHALLVANNAHAPEIPTGAHLAPLGT